MKSFRVVLVVATLIALSAMPVSATIAASRVTVATTATLIHTAPGSGGMVLIRNAGASSVFVGASTVTTETGFEVPAGDAVSIDVVPTDTVYGIVTSGTVVVHVLESRR